MIAVSTSTPEGLDLYSTRTMLRHAGIRLYDF